MQFWSDRSDREKLFLGGGALILCLAIIVQLIFVPMARWHSTSASSVNDAESLYKLVSTAARFGETATTDQRTGSLQGAITASAQAAGVSLVFVRERPDGSVETAAGPGDPTSLFRWIDMLTTQSSVSVNYADITRANEDTNLVRGRFIFAG
ncbi:MAG: type II secretion system protein GspM [Pseudomonadota bacterium]